MINIFLSFLQCEKTKECLNDLKEKLREAFTKASELIAALGRERVTQGAGTVYRLKHAPKNYSLFSPRDCLHD